MIADVNIRNVRQLVCVWKRITCKIKNIAAETQTLKTLWYQCHIPLR